MALLLRRVKAIDQRDAQLLGWRLANSHAVHITLEVAGAARCQGVGHGHTNERPRVVHRHLQPIDGHGQFRHAAPLGQGSTPFGQRIAEALATRHHLDQLVGRLDISVADLQAARFSRGEDAALEQLAGQRDGTASADGVHAVDVAQVTSVDDPLQVAHHGQRTQCTQRLVLRAIHPVQSIARGSGLAPASDGTTIAGGTLVQVVFRKQHTREVARLLPLPLLVVADGHVAVHQQYIHAAGGTSHLERQGRQILVLLSDDLPHHGFDSIGIGQGYLGLSAHGDGLEVLGAHDGAHAGPAGGTPVVVHDGGHLDQILARQADAGHTGLRLAEGRPHPLLRLVRVAAPQIGRIVQFGAALNDREPHRPGSLAGYDDPVVSGETDLRPDEAAGVGLTPDGGEGRKGTHATSAGRHHRRTDQRAGHEDQGIVGPQRIGFAIDHVIDHTRRQSTASDEGTRIPLVQRFVPKLSSAQVSAQDLAHVTVHCPLLACRTSCQLVLHGARSPRAGPRRHIERAGAVLRRREHGRRPSSMCR